MAPIHRLHGQDELKNCSANQYYNFLKNDMTKLPLICPRFFKSFQILAGDGNSVGTTWLVKLAMGTSHGGLVTLKQKIIVVDDESRKFGVRYTYTVTPIVTQGRDQSCLVKLFVEYEKDNENVPPPHEYMELATTMNEAIARHLATNA
ncbi:hypothetical protein MKW98_017598 [Papaver atlanticum]|uniref:Bet v I/Major latex protein domain-containing protein n=1 Tax=Papaver atlanticum TaxID=357466 RepID=A0AAD4TBA9_9MAGN|nr:hypothetical protein MKW98_017598 [Papaver atlanticum]